jgi:hypothetical protein
MLIGYVIHTGFDGLSVLSEHDTWVDPSAANVLMFASYALASAWLLSHHRQSQVLAGTLPTVSRRDDLPS